MTPDELSALSPSALVAHCDDIIASRPAPLHLLAVVMGAMSGREATHFHGVDIDVPVPDPLDEIAALMVDETALSQLRAVRCHRRRRGSS